MITLSMVENAGYIAGNNSKGTYVLYSCIIEWQLLQAPLSFPGVRSDSRLPWLIFKGDYDAIRSSTDLDHLT